MVKKSGILFLAAIVFVAGCASSKNRPDEPAGPAVVDVQATRQMQSRIFDTSDEKMVLSAAATTLQDLGFTLDENSPDVGLIVCSKNISFSNAKRVANNVGTTLAWTLIIFALTPGVHEITVLPDAPGTVPLDKEQKIRASVASSHVGEKEERTMLRVIVQRVAVNDKNESTTAETIADPQLYQTFFDKLAQSLSLEAHGVEETPK